MESLYRSYESKRRDVDKVHLEFHSDVRVLASMCDRDRTCVRVLSREMNCVIPPRRGTTSGCLLDTKCMANAHLLVGNDGPQIIS